MLNEEITECIFVNKKEKELFPSKSIYLRSFYHSFFFSFPPSSSSHAPEISLSLIWQINLLASTDSFVAQHFSDFYFSFFFKICYKYRDCSCLSSYQKWSNPIDDASSHHHRRRCNGRHELFWPVNP